MNRGTLKKIGFVGFEKINQLMLSRCAEIPSVAGVYAVVSENVAIEFMAQGPGGYFKGKNPNVPVPTLAQNWLEGADILYFGKAGGERSKSTLKKRVSEYMRFGQGVRIGHWGGRYIWQIRGYGDLRIGWLETPHARAVEAELISQFRTAYQKRPFANLAA